MARGATLDQPGQLATILGPRSSRGQISPLHRVSGERGHRVRGARRGCPPPQLKTSPIAEYTGRWQQGEVVSCRSHHRSFKREPNRALGSSRSRSPSPAGLPAKAYHIGRISAQQPGCQTFPLRPARTVCGVFLPIWNAHGGLAQQGYPIQRRISGSYRTSTTSLTPCNISSGPSSRRTPKTAAL